jgi:acetyl-CoA carboxylase carboxyl transferase subunit beta
MEWFKKKISSSPSDDEKKIRIPDGLWLKCNNCKAIIYKKEVIRNSNVCPKCNYHFRISATERLKALFDDSNYTEFDRNIYSSDPLNFTDSMSYRERLRKYQQQTNSAEAIINAIGEMNKIPVVIAAMEYNFMGGSMGSVVGEKVARAIEKAIEMRRPLIIICASGGARMQEGPISLMQMAKISAALARLDEEKLPYIAVLTDPTTGGVTASFGMLGDLIIAEPKALIGFAGPRVIQQTIKEDLPEGFQRAEFLLERGMIDMVVERKKLKQVLTQCLNFMLSDNSS